MIHNHNHKYNTRSKRNCYLCSSTQGCIAAKRPDRQNPDPPTSVSTQNACPVPLVGRRQVVIRNKRLVACAQSSGLPDELIFNILLLIPAKLLHENMRFVSRVWRQTITSPSFITNHLQISSACTHGLLVDHPEQQNVALYIKPPTSGYTNPEFQWTQLAKPFQSRIRGSYHGLVLLQHTPNIDKFHVVNLVTKSIVSLPCFRPLANFPTLESRALSLVAVAFSYASSINRYKAVIGIQLHGKQLLQYFPLQVWVCTVGIDQNWRKLELQGIDDIRGTFGRITYHSSTTVGGIVYWNCLSFPYGCALDVDTERFYRFTTSARPNTIPQIHGPQYWIICLQTGLGLVIYYKPEFVSRYIWWELYELTDLKSSKWTKMIDIDVRVIHSQMEKYYETSKNFPSLRPVVYTNDEKLWFVSSGCSTCMFYYHTREENVMRVPMTKNGGNSFGVKTFHHVNTLLALENC